MKKRRHDVPHVFSSLACAPLRGTFFRSIDLQWISDPLSAIGSIKDGGRFNHIGAFEALYLAQTQITALYETRSIFESAKKIIAIRQPPRAMLSIDVDLQRVLDLRDPNVLKQLHSSPDDLRKPWKMLQEDGRVAKTQRLGAAARGADIEGLLVPSARDVPDGTNLVVFVDRLREESTIELYVGNSSIIPRIKIIGTYKQSSAQ